MAYQEQPWWVLARLVYNSAPTNTSSRLHIDSNSFSMLSQVLLQVYSVNAKKREIKQKLKGNSYLPLSTHEFDALLDELIQYVHSRPRRLAVYEDVDDLLDAERESEMERMAAQAEAEDRQRPAQALAAPAGVHALPTANGDPEQDEDQEAEEEVEEEEESSAGKHGLQRKAQD